MKFVPTDKLKTGMRLAKPIYNKNGVMLYERDTKLTAQGINSIKNFGLIGIYILEQAEPLPPLSDEDREFERFQTVAVFKLKEIIEQVLSGSEPNVEMFAAELIKNYGKKSDRFTFMQNLRSNEDNVYKHSLNTAILSAAIAGKMGVSYENQKNLVIASLLHDIGSLAIPQNILNKSKTELTKEDKETILALKDGGYRLLRENCDFDSEIMKNISYLLRDLKEMELGEDPASNRNPDINVDILKVAYLYDSMTAMKVGEEPLSDIAAYKFLKHPRNRMNQQVVSALTRSINIVPVGCTVQFENGSKGIVLTDNPDDILRPFILSFRDNKLYNLEEGKVYEEYQIKDVLKTLDNRYIMTDAYDEYLKSMLEGKEKIFRLGDRI